MRKFLVLCGILAGFSALAVADDWNGKLLDASCYEKHQAQESCNAKATTTAFLLDVNGTIYHLTEGSNNMISEAMKSRADRSRNPDTPAKGSDVAAKVTGTLTGKEHIKVEKIEIQ
jgi:hypothetical protein